MTRAESASVHAEKSSPTPSAAPTPARTIWGLSPLQIYTRYWAAHGVQVVMQGEASQVIHNAELFLLSDPRSLAIFKLSHVIETLNWIDPQVLFVRLHDMRERGYREMAITDEAGRFVRFQRLYDAADSRLARVALTPDRQIAQLWQSAADPLSGWRRLRKFIPRIDRVTLSVDGSVYDRSSDRDVAMFLHELMQQWRRPDATVARARKKGLGELWCDPDARIDANAKFIGPVWVGAARHVDGGSTVIGPAIIWDDPQARPATEAIQWLEIEPTEPPEDPIPIPTRSLLARAVKRLFDIFFSLAALALSSPLWPLTMLAIWLEDGRPWFFAHRRETLHGREFSCIKFRSMRKDAEKIKAQLADLNEADGPQFFMENDPRLTRVGRFIRKTHIDELPQFINVLLGQMSVVGPRPSPRKENQYCPPWRDARLSVRPGVTGLWQIKRTRRAGTDFQEWIKYDIEYVENRTFFMDLRIILQTGLIILRKISR